MLALASGPALAASAPIAHGPNIHLRHGTSSNWSGYAAYNGTFKSISANWTQPAVSCTSQTTYSSFWVGLDGYNSSTVEQLGTEGDCSGGVATYYAWYEMYPHRGYYINMTVSPNDSMAASVVSGSRGNYTLSMTDLTTGKRFSTTQRLTSAKNASAEAIVEAPYSDGVLPLANYGTASFSSVLANGNPIGNYTVDPITMDNPYGMKSTPSALNSAKNGFTTTWSAS